MTKRILRRVVAALGIFIYSLPALALEGFEYHGYLRVGTGVSKQHTQNACYRLANGEGSTPGRLGNECEFYMESVFSHTFKKANESDKPWFRTTLNLALVSDSLQTAESTKSGDFEVLSREAFVEAGNVVTDDSVLWAGKRFYKRRDIHMFDIFLVETAGTGAGLYDVAVGPGKAHFAFLQNKSTTKYPTATDTASSPLVSTVDLRYDVLLGAGNSLETIALYGQKSAKPSQGEAGVEFEKVTGESLTFILTSEVDKTVSNRVFLQYGKGLYGASLGSGNLLNGFESDGSSIVKADGSDMLKSHLDDSSTLRIADDFVINGEEWDANLAAIYQVEDFGGASLPDDSMAQNRSIAMIGIRPSYYLSKFWRLTLDEDYTTIQNNYLVGDAKQEDNALVKHTLMLQVSPGPGYFVRPALRFFATQANWDKDTQAYLKTNPIYAASQSGTTYGVQAEAWW